MAQCSHSTFKFPAAPATANTCMPFQPASPFQRASSRRVSSNLKKPPIAAPNSSNSSTQSVSSLPPGTASSIAGGPSAKPPSHALEGYLAPAPHAQSRNYQSTSNLQHHICNLATILGVQLGQPLEGAAVRRCRCRRRLHPQLLGFRLLLQEAAHA